MDVAGRITEWGPALTPAERRVADVVLQRPQLVAFGTVAELANEAGSGAATVVRLAGKLGYDGFTALQDAVQAELAHRLRPAAERIRQPVAPDVIGRTMATELDNVQSTLEGVDREAFAQAVSALSQRSAQVVVLSGEASCGIARQAVGELALLRDGVELVVGSEVAVVRSIALLGEGDACLVVDLRRYDRWVLDAAKRAGERGATVIALTDSALSPSRCWPMPPSPSSPPAPDRSTRTWRPWRSSTRWSPPSPIACGPRPPTASTASRPRGARPAPSSSPESPPSPRRSAMIRHSDAIRHGRGERAIGRP